MSKSRSCFSILFSNRTIDISPESTEEFNPTQAIPPIIKPTIETITSPSSLTTSSISSSASPMTPSTTENSLSISINPIASPNNTETKTSPSMEKKESPSSIDITKPAPADSPRPLAIVENIINKTVITPSTTVTIAINSPSVISMVEENDFNVNVKKEEKEKQHPPTLHRSNASSDLVNLQAEEDAMQNVSFEDEDDEHQARNCFVKYILCFNLQAINLENCNKKQTVIYSIRTALSLCLAALAAYSTKRTMDSMAVQIVAEEQKNYIAVPLSCAVSLATYFFAQVTFRYFIGDKDVNPHEKRIARLERKIKFFKSNFDTRLRDIETVLASELKDLRKSRIMEARSFKK